MANQITVEINEKINTTTTTTQEQRRRRRFRQSFFLVSSGDLKNRKGVDREAGRPDLQNLFARKNVNVFYGVVVVCVLTESKMTIFSTPITATMMAVGLNKVQEM